jgi:hypothetical protein
MKLTVMFSNFANASKSTNGQVRTEEKMVTALQENWLGGGVGLRKMMKFSVRIASKSTENLTGFLQTYNSNVAAVPSCSVC